jgi:NodT family efflux transporter outer membrane factor (OMF) lipoprotein
MQGEIPLQAKWWLDFQDGSLSLLIDQAISENFSLRIARERIDEAGAIARQAGALLVPFLDGRGAESSTRNHSTNTTLESFSLGVAASYEIDLWGRLRSQRDAAILDVRATEADYHTAIISLAAAVATTWYEWVEADLQLDLLIQQQETNSQVLELISSQFRSGKVGIADVLQQRQLVESNIGDLAGLRAGKGVLEHQLAILLGIPPGTADLPQRDRLPALPPLPKTGIPLEILTARPDIESSFLRLKSADYRVAAAVADRFPQLTLSAEFSTSGNRSGDLFNNWFSTLAGNLFGPLFDGGLRKAEVARNESIARQLFYNHGETILEAIGEVEDGLVREKEQQIVLDSLKTQLQYAAETIEHVGTRYRQGAEDYQRVLLALLSHQGLQRSILSSERQLINFRISIYRALSGRIPELELEPASGKSTYHSESLHQPDKPGVPTKRL